MDAPTALPALPEEQIHQLIAHAWAVRVHAHVPFSGFRVGAALLASDGRIFTGCNVEASNYSLTMCAERVALLNAISFGVREFQGIAVAAESAGPTPPCGSCRQLLWELCGDIPVLASREEGTLGASWKLSELLPVPFGTHHFRNALRG